MSVERLRKEIEMRLERLEQLSKLEEELSNFDFNEDLIKIESGYKIPNEDTDKAKKMIKSLDEYANLIDKEKEMFYKIGTPKDCSKRLMLAPISSDKDHINHKNYRIIQLNDVFLVMVATQEIDGINNTESRRDSRNSYTFHSIVKIKENGVKLVYMNGFLRVYRGDYILWLTPDEKTSYAIEHKNKDQTYVFYVNGTYSIKENNYAKEIKEGEIDKRNLFFDINSTPIAEVYRIMKDKSYYNIINVLKKGTDLESDLSIKTPFSSYCFLKFLFPKNQNKKDDLLPIVPNTLLNETLKAFADKSIGEFGKVLVFRNLDQDLMNDVESFNSVVKLGTKG